MAKEVYIKPTESELEILQLLWLKKEASVREIHEILLKTKNAGYTTTLKLMQIMFEKGLVSRDNTSKTHLYKASIQQDVVQKHFLNKMISTLFNGNSTDLVLQVLGSHQTTTEELKEIENFLKIKKH